MSRDTTSSVAAGMPTASGRFLFRIDPELHEALRVEADAEGMSLNAYCARRLAAPPGIVSVELAPAVTRAVRQFGSDLVAVIAYGSWARGEAGPDSDLDLLIVLRSNVAITRSLYREWDEARLTAYCLNVEPSIAALPSREHPVTGLWAEVAVDGIVLFDPDLIVSRHLAAIRRRIASGEITRRTGAGQPYWVRGEPVA